MLTALMINGTKYIDNLTGFGDEAGNWEYSCKPRSCARYWKARQKLGTITISPWSVVFGGPFAVFILFMFNYEGCIYSLYCLCVFKTEMERAHGNTSKFFLTYFIIKCKEGEREINLKGFSKTGCSFSQSITKAREGSCCASLLVKAGRCSLITTSCPQQRTSGFNPRKAESTFVMNFKFLKKLYKFTKC